MKNILEQKIDVMKDETTYFMYDRGFIYHVQKPYPIDIKNKVGRICEWTTININGNIYAILKD